MKGLFEALGQIWRLAAPYFKSEERWFARGLLLVILAIELVQVFVNVQLNTWNFRFFNALQAKDIDTWARELGFFLILGCSFVACIVMQLYLNQWLQIRWRRWMTDRYLSDWLRGNNHYRMQLKGTTDNPDQRVSVDVQLFIQDALFIGLGLLGAVTTLISFIFILWGMSERTPLPIFGKDYSFPGYLVLAALLSAVLGTALAHLIGRRLIGLNFSQQRYEADFRFGLVRVRENSEQIALLRGEPVEQKGLMRTFGDVVRNWHRIMNRTLKLGLFTAGFGQFNFLLPSLLIAPSFFSGASMFGTLMQTSGAFGQVSFAFNFFVTNYGRLANWKATIDRLTGFEAAAAAAEREAINENRIKRVETNGGAVDVEALDLRLPDGRPLLEGGRLAFKPGERVLVSGPSGAGKSTMFRALGGIWPYGSGRITLPANANVMIVPQKPYLPIGPLADAVTFPAAVETWTRTEIEDVLKRVGLGNFVSRLDEPGHWSQTLSLGEQQRVAIARALLHKPDLLFLDEATASLDEPAEARLYTLLRETLPKTTIVSIGHRSALRAMHERRLMLVKEGDFSRLVEDFSPGSGPQARPEVGIA